MAFQHKPNRGSIFHNKSTDEKKPPFSGDGLIECPRCRETFQVWLSAWANQTPGGGKYLSLSIRPKDQKPESRQSSPAVSDPLPEPRQAEEPELPIADDDVPF